MMKRIAATSAAVLILSATLPLGALAQTSAWRPHGAQQRIDEQGDFAGTPRYGYGSGFYLNAPGYPYVPQGGNSGGANFPHSGT